METLTKTSLVIGMGIGQLYKAVLSKLGQQVITVDSDPSKGANFTSLDQILTKNVIFDTIHICTPNFTHQKIAEEVAPFAKIVFIEKPGVKSSTAWKELCEKFPSTHFMLVKNNMWRKNIDNLRCFVNQAKEIHIVWENKDRVPNPGSWFTNKELAFGGVSRDLIPHLLSLYIALEPNWQNYQTFSSNIQQDWQLKDLLTTDYGVADPNGVYNVDDVCYFNFDKWHIIAKWKNTISDERNVVFYMPDESKITFELGLCPEDAYQTMIKDALDHINDTLFWQTQFQYDMWIHQKIENL